MQADCLFCKMATQVIPVNKVYESDLFFAIKDINPQAEVHLLLIPKEHYTNLLDQALGAEAGQQLMGALASEIQTLALQQNLKERGFRVIQNNGEGAGQSVLHLHFHVVADAKLPMTLC